MKDDDDEGTGANSDDAVSIAGSDVVLLRELDEDLDDEEKTDTAVASSLAKIVNKRFAGKLSEEKVKEKFAKYARPANCEELRVHNVNSEIWKIVPTKSRKNDVKTAHLQILLVKAAMAVTKSTQTMLKAQKGGDSKHLKNAVEQNTDAIALLGHASRELSQHNTAQPQPDHRGAVH